MSNAKTLHLQFADGEIEVGTLIDALYEQDRTIAILRQHKADYMEAAEGTRKALEAERERLRQFEIAYNDWQAKTDWVQESAKPHELGRHRADVLRARIEALAAELREELDAAGEIQAQQGRRNTELRAERDALAAELAAIKGQQPGAWRMWNGKTWRFCYSYNHAKNGWEPLYSSPQPGQDVRALVSADDVRDACANAVSVFAEETNAGQCREVAEYMREVLLAQIARRQAQRPA